MTQSPFYEAPGDYGSTTTNTHTNQRLLIIIVLLLFFLLCCCCIALIVLWFTGDSIIEMLESANLVARMLWN